MTRHSEHISGFPPEHETHALEEHPRSSSKCRVISRARAPRNRQIAARNVGSSVAGRLHRGACEGVSACVHVCMHACVHVCMPVCVGMHARGIHAQMQTRTHTSTHDHTQRCMRTHMRTHTSHARTYPPTHFNIKIKN